MNTVPAGITLPFEVSLDRSDLYVAMNVFDCTGGTPTLHAQIPMPHVGNFTYVGFFQAVAGKSYVLNKSVYTDSTYATRDVQNYPEVGSESFYASAETDVSVAIGQLQTIADALAQFGNFEVIAENSIGIDASDEDF